MRYKFSYRSYPDCPRATDYSHDAEYFALIFGYVVNIAAFGAVAYYVVETFSFFDDYNWFSLFRSIAVVIIVALALFFCYCIRPNHTDYRIKVILLEDRGNKLPDAVFKQHVKSLKRQKRLRDKEEFLLFFPIFLFALLDSFSVIAAIKGILFLCNSKNGLPFILVAIPAIVVFTFLICLFAKKISSKPTQVKKGEINDGWHLDRPIKIQINDKATCKTCGAKLPFGKDCCAICGTKN